MYVSKISTPCMWLSVERAVVLSLLNAETLIQFLMWWRPTIKLFLWLIYNCNFATILNLNVNMLCRISDMGPLWKTHSAPKEVVGHRLRTAAVEARRGDVRSAGAGVSVLANHLTGSLNLGPFKSSTYSFFFSLLLSIRFPTPLQLDPTPPSFSLRFSLPSFSL